MEPWTDPARALPSEHAAVRFIVTGHHRPLVGTYEHACFRARWGAYTSSEVETWYPLDIPVRAAPRDPPVPVPSGRDG